MTRIAVLALALLGVANIAHAQTVATDMACQRHQAAMTDEYGFKYDAQGNRLDAKGCVIPAPRTAPGAHVIQNGR